MEEIKNLFKKMVSYLGLDESSSKVYTTLYFSEKPLTVKEIVEKSGYSIARVYASLSILMDMNLVEKKRDMGQIVIVANPNFTILFENFKKNLMINYLKPLSELDNRDKIINTLSYYSKKLYESFLIMFDNNDLLADLEEGIEEKSGR
ncbi:MAG: helix-turn-helix domain-containing protein [Thermoplasmata archaeon]